MSKAGLRAQPKKLTSNQKETERKMRANTALKTSPQALY